MKYELEFRNLEKVRQLLNEDKQFEACTTLLSLGNLLIQCEDTQSMKPVTLLGQYSKIGGQLSRLYNTLMKTFSPEDELKKYESRLQEVEHNLQQIEAQYDKLEPSYNELLKQEKALYDKKRKLEKWIAEKAKLTKLKENEIKQLENQSRLLEETLEQLNEEAENVKSSLNNYQAELSEDGRLIRNLPDQYGTIHSVDELITELKKQEHQLQDTHASYEQGLITLIEEIKNSYEVLKGNSHE